MGKERNRVCEYVSVKEILYKTHDVSTEKVSECTREGDEGTEYNGSVWDTAWAQSEWKLRELLFLCKVQSIQGQAEVGRELTKCTMETAEATEINYSIQDIECNGCAESVKCWCECSVKEERQKRRIARAMISTRNIYHSDLHNHRIFNLKVLMHTCTQRCCIL
jgi:hypothetical protein